MVVPPPAEARPGALPTGHPRDHHQEQGRQQGEGGHRGAPQVLQGQWSPPICKRAAPFITLDNLWAQRVLGLSTLSARGADHSVEFDDGEVHDITATLNAIGMAPGKKKGRPKTHEHLEDRLHPFRPLELTFGQASTVKRWFKGPQKTTLPFPSTVRTDGVQLHVPIEVPRTVPADVAASLKDGRERKSKDPRALAAQLGRPDGKGEFAEVAAATLPRPNQDALARPHVGVDPGYIFPVAASNGYTITRKDFYHGRMEPRRGTFAPNGGGGGGGGASGGGGAGNVPPPAHRRESRDFTTRDHTAGGPATTASVCPRHWYTVTPPSATTPRV